MRCLNPSSKYCECPACGEDKRAIGESRNRVVYGKHKNPLVDWTLSEEWITPPALPKVRGMSENDGMHTAHFAGETAGEIPWRKYDLLTRKFV